MTTREIILSDRINLVAIVDDEDYHYLVRWRWTYKKSERKFGMAYYACRNTTNGSRSARIKIMMHNVVLKRAGKRRPSELHTGHHRNRKTLDNTRDNLEWATKKKQVRERGAAKR